MVEFVAFGEQLSCSHTKALAQTELCLLDLALHASKGWEKFAAASSEKLAVPGMLCNLLVGAGFWFQQASCCNDSAEETFTLICSVCQGYVYMHTVCPLLTMLCITKLQPVCNSRVSMILEILHRTTAFVTRLCRQLCRRLVDS